MAHMDLPRSPILLLLAALLGPAALLWGQAAPVEQPRETPAKAEPAADKGEAEKEAKPEGEGGIEIIGTDEADRVGYDRPMPYPRIRFAPAKPAGSGAAEEGAAPERSRVYLVDVSDAMGASITVGGVREVTRAEHLNAQLDAALDRLANRRDHRFNLVTFGRAAAFAKGQELPAASPETTARAKEWLREQDVGGRTDIYAMLRECFQQGPDSAVLLVGGLPASPEGADEAQRAEITKAGGLQEFLIAQVRRWREEGKKTTLDITGIGLSEPERQYYRRLAQAGGGTYLDA
jgi:hypothetical protein